MLKAKQLAKENKLRLAIQDYLKLQASAHNKINNSIKKKEKNEEQINPKIKHWNKKV